ncbi:hypothetical protein HYT45_02505 [Candidatus Uhrbacteria bacterium]|nr:hypothetical protein [Candidatus Uhrbacteria bacterium]
MRKEKIIIAGYFAVVIILAAVAGIGRNLSVYADISAGTARFPVVLAALLAGVIVMFYALKHTPSRKWVYAGAIFAAFIFLFLPPIASGDALTSLFRVKIFGITRLNPYLVAPSQFPGDSWPMGGSWRHIPMPYGPLWVIFSIIFIPFIKFNSVAVALIFYKLTLSAMAIFAGRLLYRIASEIGTDGRKAELLFLWNPLVLLTVFSDSHNDMAMLFLFLPALYFLLKENFRLSLLALAASALVKYVAILALPFFILHIFRRTGNVKKTAKAMIPSLIFPFIAFLPFWKGAEIFRGLFLASSIISPNSFIVHSGNLLGAKIYFYDGLKPWIWGIALILIGAVFCWSAKGEGRIIKGIILVFFIAAMSLTELFNWYLLWPLILFPLVYEPKWKMFLLYVTFFGVLHIDWRFWKSAVWALILSLALTVLDERKEKIRQLCQSKVFGKL